MNVSTGQQTASNAANTPTMISEIGIVTESPELHFSAPFREVAPAQLLPQQRERHAEE
jgi:hypothetical protein